METILTYHILPKDVWEQESKNATFGHHEIEKYGFIHSSKLEGLGRIIHRYKDVDDYVALLIRIGENDITYEDKDIVHYYPHMYQPIDQKNIVKKLPLRDLIENKI